MPSRREIDERCVHLALSQRGVISLDQAMDCGLSMSAMQRRLQSGRWVLLHPGIYRLRECPPSWEQSLLAACLWGREGTVASHRAAARLWRLGLEEAPVEILAPVSTRPRPGIVLHRTDSLSRTDMTRTEGVPVTSPTRTLIDLGAVTSTAVVERCLETALRERLTSIWYLAERLDELGKPGRRGAGTLRRVLRERDPRFAPTESELESLLWQLLSRSRLPYPNDRCRSLTAKVWSPDWTSPIPDNDSPSKPSGFDTTRVSAS